MSMTDAVKRFFTGKPVLRKPSVAVEIGTEWVKVAQCKYGLGGARLEKLGCKAISGGESAETALRQLFKETRCRSRDVILCLPRNQVAVRILRIPATNPDEISKMVHLQAGRLTPYSSDEVVSAYEVLGADESGYSTVILAIARRRLVSEKSLLVSKCGGSVGAVAAGTEGACRQMEEAMVTELKGDAPVAVLNVDADFSELVVFYQGNAAFSKNILIGGDNLKADISRWQGELINEILTGIDQFSQENDAAGNVEEILLVGLGELPSLSQALEKVCNITIRKVDLLSAVPGGSRLNRRSTPVSTAAVVGCAFDSEKLGVDLLPPEDRLTKVMGRRRNQLNVMGVLGLFIVTLLLALLVVSHYERRLVVENLEDQVSRIEPVAKMTELRKSRVYEFSRRLDARGTPLSILTELNRITPEEIYLTQLQILAKDEVLFRGRAEAMTHVFDYVKVLENSKLLENVEPTSNKTLKNSQEVEFTIVCRFQTPDSRI